jgi:hypothetical protein
MIECVLCLTVRTHTTKPNIMTHQYLVISWVSFSFYNNYPLVGSEYLIIVFSIQEYEQRK